jgi:anti-sigma regulatory factor (Ser/Thr protein kinase)
MSSAVGGDFYDFLTLPDGRLMIVVGDVTDKGVPAALLMATTRSVLRGAAGQATSPGTVLARANDLLCAEMPPNMFVTCFCALLDPGTGRLRFANAGHNLPYWHGPSGIGELAARGMPLGLLPGQRYEEGERTIAPGETVLFCNDGLVEAHNPRREMFGQARLAAAVQGLPGGAALLDALLRELAAFTGPDWEQEDDVTLVTLQRLAVEAERQPAPALAPAGEAEENGPWRELAAFSVPSQPGNERLAMRQVAEAVSDLALPTTTVERLKTAVAEATMNAMEHGNGYRAELPVRIAVLVSPSELAVRIIDQGSGGGLAPAVPDLEAKLAGLQTPRGWGLFLIKHMVDEMQISDQDGEHTVTLITHLNRGGTDDGPDEREHEHAPGRSGGAHHQHSG